MFKVQEKGILPLKLLLQPLFPGLTALAKAPFGGVQEEGMGFGEDFPEFVGEPVGADALEDGGQIGCPGVRPWEPVARIAHEVVTHPPPSG